MKVNLIKEAEYELDVDKCSKIPFEAFMKMTNVKINCEPNPLPNVLIFNSVDDFKNYHNNDNFDTMENIYVANNGKIFVFLKKEITTSDESADTEENSVEKS